MVAEHLRGHGFFVNRRVEQRVIDQAERFAPALNVDRFSRAPAEIDGDDLISPLGSGIKKWQTHNHCVFSRSGANSLWAAACQRLQVALPAREGQSELASRGACYCGAIFSQSS